MKMFIALCAMIPAFQGSLSAADLMPGWPIPQLSARFTVANVDSDPQLEIIVMWGAVYIYDFDGSLLPGWSTPLGGSGLPLIGDINGDGEKDIVSVYGTPFGAYSHNAVSTSGLQMPGWPVDLDQESWNVNHPFITLVDLDGDGDDEYVTLGRVADRLVYAIDGDGTPVPGWPVQIPVPPGLSLFWTSIASGDVDFDGQGDVLVGLYLRDGPFLQPSPSVWIRGDGTIPTGWPAIPPSTWSSQQLLHPMMADLDGDLVCEIFGSGFHELQSLRADGTEYLPALSAPFASRPAACGDVDGNGSIEIVMPGERLKVYGSTGSLLAQTNPAAYWLYDGITLGDVDGDGVQEICAVSMRVGTDTEVWIHLLDYPALTNRAGWPKYLGNIQPSGFQVTALADLDADGDIEVITAYNGLYAWDEPNPSGLPLSCEWPFWGHDAKRSMNYHGGGAIPVRMHLPGDANGDDALTLADAVVMLTHLFVTASGTNCLAAFDFDGGEQVDLADPISLLGYLFAGAPPPGGVIPDCGPSGSTPLPCTRTSCP